MARRKWNANSNVAWDDRTFLRRYGLLIGIAVFLAIAGGTLYYRYINSDAYKYGINATEKEREISACVDDRSRAPGDEAAAEHATAACVDAVDNDKAGDKAGP
jgi:hypothetical protein